jgi:hypothetical protein
LRAWPGPRFGARVNDDLPRFSWHWHWAKSLPLGWHWHWHLALALGTDTNFMQKVFCSVFEHPSLEKLTWKFLSTLKKKSTWTFCKNILMVFLNSHYRETPKNVVKTNQKMFRGGIISFIIKSFTY